MKCTGQERQDPRPIGSTWDIWDIQGGQSNRDGQVFKTLVWTNNEKESGKRKTWVQYIFCEKNYQDLDSNWLRMMMEKTKTISWWEGSKNQVSNKRLQEVGRKGEVQSQDGNCWFWLLR